jgi:DNA-binding LacI/PurR family transcriptional regulator
VPRRSFTAEPHAPKYRQVFEVLSKDIRSGRYASGQKLPSEAALVQQFETSRITVGRAMRELAERGLIDRIAGSGTYVRRASSKDAALTFGLLIPELGATEIFEPICRGISGSPLAAEHALLWGHATAVDSSPEQTALQLCEQYLQRRVAGVFFAPLETGADARETNLAIVARFEQQRVPIVLLDRCVLPYPGRIHHDLVGIDNRRAGFMATEHLLNLGVRRVSLIASRSGASTIEARITGFRETLLAHGRESELHAVHRLQSVNPASLAPVLNGVQPGDGFVCANDRTAGELMQALTTLGYRIPSDFRIVGIDDVEYASLLPVPLTTVHQPCREIGEAAMAAMLERIARPNLFIRDILVECRLVIRDSCGSKPA